MASPPGEGRQHLGGSSLGVVVGEAAAVHRAESVDDGNLIPGAVAEHPDAVAGFLGVETGDAALHRICIEDFHS